MVTMYRMRGEPRKSSPGEYFACSISHDIIKEGKWWFGLFYSQKVWDALITKGSEGYPLTDAELTILGMVFVSKDLYHREYIEQHAGITEKLAYLVLNDLRSFGFLDEDESGLLRITPRGEKALHGIARRIYEKRFMPEMLENYTAPEIPVIERAQRSDKEQTSLF